MVDTKYKERVEDAFVKIREMLRGIEDILMGEVRELRSITSLDFSFIDSDLERKAFVIFVPSGHNSNGEIGIKTYDGANFPDYMAQNFIEDMRRLYPYSSLTTPIDIQAGNSHIAWDNLYPT